MKLPTSLLAASAVAAVATGALADELVIGTRNETTSIDPHFYNTSSNHQVVAHVFEYLVIKDNRQRLKPGLAESWRPVDDTTWEFKLRKDVRLSDGTPFTADDFMYNVERSTSGDLKLPAPSTRYMLGKTYKKIDDYTIHVSAGKPYPLMPNDMSVSPLVSAKYGKGAKTEDYNSGKATIGSGPYKFVEWVPGDRVVLEPNPNYWGAEKAKWDKITYKVIKADPSRLAALLNRDVDLIDYVPTTDVKRLANEPKVALTRIESNRVIYLHLDQWRDVSPYVKKNDGSDFDHNPLRKVKVRLALSMAINRPAIVDRVMDGAAKPAGQLPVDGMFGFNPALTPHAYDPEGAKKLLAEAGYPDGFRITVHGPNDRYVNDGKIVETVAGMLARVGIRAEVHTQPKSTYFARAKDYSFVLVGFGSDTGEASSAYTSLLHTPDPDKNLGRVNRGRYSNAQFDKLIQGALSELDAKKREKNLMDAGKISYDEVGLIPLHYQMNVWAHRPDLTYEARTDERTYGFKVGKKM